MFDDHWSLKRAFWKEKFAFLPKTCSYSNKRIWFEKAYLGTRMITGPGDPITVKYWLTRSSYVILTLKGLI